MKVLLSTIVCASGLVHAASMYSVVDLGTMGGSSPIAYRINSAGTAVSWAQTPLDDNHAFTSSGGTLIDLNQPATSNSQAFGINSAGQVVGISFIDGQNHGSIWNNSAFTDLGAGNYALAINSSGEIAG